MYKRIAFFLIALLCLQQFSFAANIDSTVRQEIPAVGDWTTYFSPSSETTKVVKASAGTLQFACYTNQSTTDLMIMVFDSVTVPVDGAVTPVACGPIPKGTATLVSSGCYTPPVPITLATGLSVAVSSGVNCFNKTAAGSGMFTVQYK